MNTLITGNWLTLLTDVSVKSMAILLVAVIGIRLSRRTSAAWRHAVLLLVLFSLLGLPVLSMTLPKWRVPVFPALPAPPGKLPGGRARRARANTQAYSFSKAIPVVSNRIPATQHRHQISDGAGSLSETSTIANGTKIDWPLMVFATWLVGVGIVLSRTVANMLIVQRAGRACRLVSGGPMVSMVGRLSQQLQLNRSVRLLLSNSGELIMPMTWGWLRPLILLPGDAESWTEDRLRIVLLHELSHVQRHDWLAQMFAHLTCAFYWFNPLVWFLACRLRWESDRACDDRVLTSGIKASDYAVHLMDIVRSRRGEHGSLLTAMAAGQISNIERRLSAILSENNNLKTITRRTFVLALLTVLAILVPLAAVARPIAKTRSSKTKSPITRSPGLATSTRKSITKPVRVASRSQKGIVLKSDDAGNTEKSVIEKTLSSQDVTKVRTDVFIGTIRVITDSPDAIRVSAVRSASGGSAAARKRLLEQIQFLIRKQGGVVEVRDVVPENLRKEQASGEGEYPRSEVEIHMPSGLALSASILVGDVQVEGQVGDASIKSTAGSVRLRRLECKGKNVDVETAAGDVEVSLRSLPADRLKVNVAAGNVRLSLPERHGATIKMETATGRVKSANRVSTLQHEKGFIGDTLAGELNGGGTTVEVHVAAGDIRLEAEGELKEEHEEKADNGNDALSENDAISENDAVSEDDAVSEEQPRATTKQEQNKQKQQELNARVQKIVDHALKAAEEAREVADISQDVAERAIEEASRALEAVEKQQKEWSRNWKDIPGMPKNVQETVRRALEEARRSLREASREMKKARQERSK